MVTAPTIPHSIAALVAPIRAGSHDFVIGSRLRGEREPGSMAWHQIAAGLSPGFGMRMLYGVRYTDMCAFRAIRRDMLLGLGMREMTYGWNIEMQMRAARRRPAHPRDSGSLSLPQRRRLQGRRKPVRQHQGGGSHRRDLRARFDPAADCAHLGHAGKPMNDFGSNVFGFVPSAPLSPAPITARLRCSGTRSARSFALRHRA